MNRNAEIYIEKYKELENAVRNAYGLSDGDSIAYYLRNQDRFKKFRDEIKYCQDVRNFLQHELKIDNEFTVLPGNNMIQFIDMLIAKVKNKLCCGDIAIKMNKVYWQSETGQVKKTMIKMREQLYTHIPILKDGRVVGVFDENSVFNYLAHEEIAGVDENLRFSDISEYLLLEGREMEQFMFASMNTYLEKIEERIENAYKQHKRIGVVFLTDNGKADGKLQGIITPWDIIGVEE